MVQQQKDLAWRMVVRKAAVSIRQRAYSHVPVPSAGCGCSVGGDITPISWAATATTMSVWRHGS